MKTNDTEQWTIASLEIQAGKQNEMDKKLHLITNNAVTILPYDTSTAPLKAIKQAINNNFTPNGLIEIEVNPFLTIEQPELILIPMLQKLGSQTLDVYMAVLGNPVRANYNIKMEHNSWLCRRI